MAQVLHLFVAVERRKPMKAVQRVLALTDRGFEGCAHARPGGKRQVLLMDAETLREFDLVPGIVRENITTAGLRTSDLKPGQRLKIGGAVLEISVTCEPCFHMDEIRMGLQEALRDRRGVLCRVIEGGPISCGDLIEIYEAAVAIPSVGGAH